LAYELIPAVQNCDCKQKTDQFLAVAPALGTFGTAEEKPLTLPEQLALLLALNGKTANGPDESAPTLGPLG